MNDGNEPEAMQADKGLVELSHFNMVPSLIETNDDSFQFAPAWGNCFAFINWEIYSEIMLCSHTSIYDGAFIVVRDY